MVRSSTIINLIKKSCELKKYIKKQTILYTKKNISLFKNLKLFFDKYLQINKKLPRFNNYIYRKKFKNSS